MTRRARRPCKRCANRIARLHSRSHVREPSDRFRQIVQPPVRVAGRQFRLRVPGELLQRPQVDSGQAAQRQVGVTQRVEVRVLEPAGTGRPVRDAGRGQVAAPPAGTVTAPTGPGRTGTARSARPVLGHHRRQPSATAWVTLRSPSAEPAGTGNRSNPAAHPVEQVLDLVDEGGVANRREVAAPLRPDREQVRRAGGGTAGSRPDSSVAYAPSGHSSAARGVHLFKRVLLDIRV